MSGVRVHLLLLVLFWLGDTGLALRFLVAIALRSGSMEKVLGDDYSGSFQILIQ